MNRINETGTVKCPKCSGALKLTESKFSGGAYDIKPTGEYELPCISLYNCSNCAKIWDDIELVRNEELQDRLAHIRLQFKYN